MGDFTGFTFGDWHSTDPETGLVTVLRVSGGDRYEEEIHPDIKDITAEVPGVDGEYYFGSNYGPKKVDIEIAFDSLTEEQFRQMRRVFGTRKIKDLIFDERPYKKYMAKIESPIELSYICFDEPKRIIDAERNGVIRDRENDSFNDKEFSETITIPQESRIDYTLQYTPKENTLSVEGMEYEIDGDVIVFNNETEEDIDVTISYVYEVYTPAWKQVTPWKYENGTQRIYKGEGKISFICYFPFAKSVYKQLPIGEEESDWAISSGILSVDRYETIDKFDESTGRIFVYNGGDLPVGFRLYLPKTSGATTISATTLEYKEDGMTTAAALNLNDIMVKDGDVGVLIDTNSEVIVGVSLFTHDESGNAIYETSGNLYNEYVDSGYFFRLNPNINVSDFSLLEVRGVSSGVEIFYDYLYF